MIVTSKPNGSDPSDGRAGAIKTSDMARVGLEHFELA